MGKSEVGNSGGGWDTFWANKLQYAMSVADAREEFRCFNWGVHGAFTAQLTGCTTAPTALIDVNCSFGSVTLSIPDLTATSNSTTATLTTLPVPLRPSATETVLLRVVDNGVVGVGLAKIGTDGVITLYKDVAESAFTASGTKGVKTCSVTYVWGS